MPHTEIRTFLNKKINKNFYILFCLFSHTKLKYTLSYTKLGFEIAQISVDRGGHLKWDGWSTMIRPRPHA